MRKTDSYIIGGRKFSLILLLTILFLVFGGYIVFKNGDLSDGALYIGAVGATAYGYFRENVKQHGNQNQKQADKKGT